MGRPAEAASSPCAATPRSRDRPTSPPHTEKDGSFTNTHRLLQWRHKAVEPPGDCRSELHFTYHLGKRLQSLYKDSADPKDRGPLALTWDY